SRLAGDRAKGIRRQGASYGLSDVRRSPWAYTPQHPSRAKPTRHSPVDSASAIASAVGAEIAARRGMPAWAAFIASSELARLVTTAKPEPAMPAGAIAPTRLASALVRARAAQPT